MIRSSLAALALTLLLAGGGAAQAVPGDTGRVEAPTAAAPAPATAMPAVSADSGRVAVPRPSALAVRYHRSGNTLWLIATFWSLLLPAFLLFTGFSARIRDISRRTGRRWFFTIAIYGLFFTLITWAIDLPLSYYAGFLREHEYGLSNQAFSKWRDDQLRGLLLGVIGTVSVLWIPYLMLRRSPKRWWLYSGLAFIPLIVFVVLIQPVFVDPMFNDFGRLRDRTLERDILAVADRAGIEGGRVYEVAKSVDTNTMNAYVTGLGATKRIVLWDTLLRRMDRREVLFVMAHEIGHYVLGHVIQLLVLSSLLVLLSFYAVHCTAGWVITRYSRRMGFTELSDVASLPLLILIVNLLGLAVAPGINGFVRHMEHEADRFALEVTRDNHAGATAFVKLQSNTLSVPYPGTLEKLWRGSHPALGERIDFANQYRPWERGEPLRYGDRIRPATGSAPRP